MPTPSTLARPAAASAVAPRPLTADRPFAGIGLTCLSMAVFSGMDGLSKLLASKFTVFEIAWARFFFILILIAPVILAGGGRHIRSTRPHLQIVRGLCMLGSGLFFILGLARMPIADATAIGFVSPLFVTALSIPILGEQVGLRRWSAVAVGFIGVLVLVRPGTASFNPAAFLPVASAACWALGLIITRIMQSSDSVPTTLFWSTAVGFLVLTPVAVPAWQPPSTSEWGLLFLAAVLGTIGQFFLISAFRFGAASLLAPFSYSQIVWATLMGYFLFDALPDAGTGIGAAIIMASGLYVLHRERVVRRRRATSSPP